MGYKSEKVKLSELRLFIIFLKNSALKTAAKIAGFDVLGIMNENSAVALYYGLERIDNTTHRVLFYNVGAYNLQVSLVEYLAVNDSQTKKLVESIKVLSDYSIPNAGGQTYDLALANYFAQLFD